MSGITDIWDDQRQSTQPTFSRFSNPNAVPKRKILPSPVLRDDWEDDDDDDELEQDVVERNKRIWDDANAKESQPMPEFIISRGTSTVSTTTLPLNQPPAMRILKRPSPSPSPSASANAANNTAETLKEREARYHAARERIFGAPPQDDATPDADKKPDISPQRSTVRSTPPPPTSTKLVREPRGPIPNYNGGNEPGFEHKGFSGRETKRPPPPTSGAIHSPSPSFDQYA